MLLPPPMPRPHLYGPSTEQNEIQEMSIFDIKRNRAITRFAKSQRHAARQSGKRITAQELTDPGTLEPCDNLCYCAYGDFSLADMARWIGLPLNQYESITRHMLSTGKREVICDPACQDCEGSGFISSGENDYAQNDRWQKHLRPMHCQRSWSGCSSMGGLNSGTC